MKILRRLILVFALSLSGGAFAVQPGEILKDERLEARARSISAGLRCLVCQNQSIDDSDAPLAKDLRVLVRERLTAGDSDEQVLRFVVARYGDFILLKPPVNTGTILLWTTPALVLFLACLLILNNLRSRRRNLKQTRPLDTSEEAQLRAILDKNPP
ncbi:MAG: cytochrome c-type biogenesis protein CcmH [Beijerinckiaceae bacterium]